MSKKNESNIIKELDHHCHLLVGNISVLKEQVLNDLFKLGIEHTANPDFTFLERDNFSVKDTENLILQASFKSFDGAKKIFIITLNTISLEAQNKFLKILEEPAGGVFFFIICPQNIFLPTFLSRVKTVKLPPTPGIGDSPIPGVGGQEVEEILKMSLGEKFNLIGKLVKDINDEKKQKQSAVDFINQIGFELLNYSPTPGIGEIGKSPYSPIPGVGEERLLENKNKLLACQIARKRILQNGAMIKMVLENLVIRI